MSKKNLTLSGILLVMVAFVYLYQGPFQDWREKSETTKNFLSALDPAAINTLEITADNKTAKLIKSGDRWKIDGTKDFYVKDSVASELNTILSELGRADLDVISTNKDKKSEFETDESGIRVVLKQGEKMFGEFIIGKTASDYINTYISRPADNATYIIEKNIRSVFARDRWEDDTIFSGDKERITSIRFQYPKREFTITKKDDIWEGTAPVKFTVAKEKAEAILEIMSNLTAADIPTQTFAGTGLEKNLIIIQATGDGIDNILMVGDENGEGLYFAKRGNSDNIYLISKEQRDTLNTDSKKLK
jgi:hypothetical protein